MALLLRPLCALAFLVVVALLGLLAAPGSANAAQDCCLRVPPQPQPFSRKMQNQLVAYRVQGPQMGCQREAVVFITKKRRELCVSPDADWVAELMKKVDTRNQKAEANRRGV